MTHHIAETATNAAHKVTVSSGVFAAISGLSLSEWGVVVGIVIGVLSFVTGTAINIWFKRQQLKILRQKT